MKTVTIKPRKIPMLTVKIGAEEYKLPLASALTVKEAAALNTFDGTVAFYAKHIPQEVLDALSIDELNQITEAWKSATEEAGSDSGK